MTANTKPTQGPWHVSADYGRSRRLVMAGDRCIAIVKPDHRRKGQTKANARLIAAAPDLLLALQLICDNPDHDLLPSERADAEAAIRKALGTAGKP